VQFLPDKTFLPMVTRAITPMTTHFFATSKAARMTLNQGQL
jgi:hypothetical protein